MISPNAIQKSLSIQIVLIALTGGVYSIDMGFPDTAYQD